MKPWSFPASPPVTPGIHVEGELPGPASSPEGKAAMATAISTALTAASQSPEFRLRMILGEAYQRYLVLVQWLAGEIEKDEAKAPGLKELALSRAFNPIRFRDRGARDNGPLPQDIFDAQTALLEKAIEAAPEPQEITRVKTIENTGCANDCTHPSHRHVQV